MWTTLCGKTHPFVLIGGKATDEYRDGQLLAEAGHGPVFAGNVRQGEVDTRLHRPGVGEAELIHKIGAGLLHPADVIAVPDDAHAVGLVELGPAKVGLDLHAHSPAFSRTGSTM